MTCNVYVYICVCVYSNSLSHGMILMCGSAIMEMRVLSKGSWVPPKRLRFSLSFVQLSVSLALRHS